MEELDEEVKELHHAEKDKLEDEMGDLGGTVISSISILDIRT